MGSRSGLDLIDVDRAFKRTRARLSAEFKIFSPFQGAGFPAGEVLASAEEIIRRHVQGGIGNFSSDF
jgi:hypothetical protein